MDITKLEEVLGSEPAFRLRQARHAVFTELLDDWKSVTTLSKPLRERLSRQCPLGISAQLARTDSDQVGKSLITLSDGLKIETVLMRHKDGRNTVCVSSQVGCALGCEFCATGRIGFRRNLDPGEIVQQVLFFARRLKPASRRVTNVVFMGMGEPFLNYDNVLAAAGTLNDPQCFGLGARSISISTVGVIDGINRLAGEPLQVNLAVSLNAPDDRLRATIMPSAKTYRIDDILAAVDRYIEKTHRRVMFEYITIKGVNDSDDHAGALAALLRSRLCFVNLIAYNPTGAFKASSPDRIRRFKAILESAGLSVTQRHRFGDKIHGACGQLAAGQ